MGKPKHYALRVTWEGNTGEGTRNYQSYERSHVVSVSLRPRIRLRDPALAAKADALHREAHEKCFIARSVRFPVSVEATYG